jgi:hypothetical protein
VLLLIGRLELLEGQEDDRPLKTLGGMDSDQVDGIRILMGGRLSLLDLVLLVLHTVPENLTSRVETLGHDILGECLGNVILAGILDHPRKQGNPLCFAAKFIVLLTQLLSVLLQGIRIEWIASQALAVQC